MPPAALRFAMAWLSPSLPLLAGCVYRPLPLLDGSGGGGAESGGTTGGGGVRSGLGGAGFGGINSGAGGAAGTTESPDAGRSDGSDVRIDSPDATASGPPPPRLIAPLSTATVTSQRPTLRWALAAGTDGAHVQICRDRACAAEVASFDADGASAAPPARLSAGVLFWRAYGRHAGQVGALASPTWQMTVGARSAPLDASWGTTLDVNGDGYADVIISAQGAGNGIGRAYLYLGGAAGLSTSPATTLSGPDGPGGSFGNAVASAGDVNGDGFADLIIGASGADNAAGRAYVYLGSAAGISSSPSTILTGLDGYGGGFGISVASAGDVNGDGFADLIIGASEASNANGRAYLYLGSAAGISIAPSATLTGPDGDFGDFGASVASAGDVNGDGFADVIIGVPGADSYGGRTYLYLGGTAGLLSSPTAALAHPDVKGGFLGAWVAGAGDVDGDGYADVIAGVAGSNSMQAYLYRGGVAGLSAPIATLDVPDSGGLDSGYSIASAGDVNGDGFADVIVGAYQGSDTGHAYLYLGGAIGLPPIPSASFAGLTGPGQFGVSVAGAGDVDGDGFADVIIGANAVSSYGGQVYLYRGAATGLSPSPGTTLTGPDGADGDFGAALASDDASGRLPPVSQIVTAVASRSTEMSCRVRPKEDRS